MERPYHGNDESDKSDLTRLLSCLFCQNNLLPQPPHTQTDTNLKTKLKTEDTTIKLIRKIAGLGRCLSRCIILCTFEANY